MLGASSEGRGASGGIFAAARTSGAVRNMATSNRAVANKKNNSVVLEKNILKRSDWVWI